MVSDPRMPCIVCHASALEPFMAVGGLPYWRCGHCLATIMDPRHWPDPRRERAVYDLHDNDPGDPGYRRFLDKLVQPLLARLSPGARGLDFGCGPGPALAGMLAQRGLEVALYDPIYQPDTSVLATPWDFITCTEVAEHLHDPHTVFGRFHSLLKPGAWLAVMTCFQTDDRRFANWHYRRDPTHVVFYREHTLHTIARRFHWRLEIPVKDVALFQAPYSDPN